MKSRLFKIGSVYTLFLFILCLSITISCKKNSEPENNDTNLEKKETMSCLTIKDYIGISKTDHINIPYTPVPGDSQVSLLKNAYSLYTKYWENELKRAGDFEEEDPAYDGVIKVKEIISDPSTDIKVKTIHDNIAVINRTERGMDGYIGLVKIDDIWILESNQWKRLEGHESNSYRKARLLHLNNDEYIDAVVEGGCCDSQEIDVYIGNKDKILTLQQIITIYGEGGLDYTSKCNSKLDIKPYEGMYEQYGTRPKLAIFDCKSNGFIIKED